MFTGSDISRAIGSLVIGILIIGAIIGLAIAGIIWLLVWIFGHISITWS